MGLMMEKESMCKKRANTLAITETFKICATVSETSYTPAYLHTAVVTTVVIIATNLCTSAATDNVWQ